MPDLRLSLACWDYDRTQPLWNGTVKPEGLSLTYVPIGMPESFFRMLHFAEFDVSEMSLAWYARTVEQDPRPFVAIPVFPSRMFRHGCIYVNARSGIVAPQDLIGKRVGLPEYQITAAVWLKGILAEHHGVPINSVSYFTGGLHEPGRTEAPINLPAGICVQHIGAANTLSRMLDEGEIDALYTAEAPESFLVGSPNVKRLFGNYREAEQDYYRTTGIFPIMHTIVIRWDVYQQNPWVARSLTKAFSDAQRVAYRDVRETVATKTMLPWMRAHYEETVAAFGTEDFWAYGVESNEHTLRTFLRYCFEQGLTSRALEPVELFAREMSRTARV